MNCKTVQNQLSAYLDRELTGPEMLAIRSHLAECDPCREEEQSLRALKRLLAATTVPDPSPDLADRLCASVLSVSRSPEPARPRHAFRGGVLTFVGVAACSMALTYSVLSHMRSPGLAPETRTAAARPAQDLNFDVQRDQVYAIGPDATVGLPVLGSPQDAGR